MLVPVGELPYLSSIESTGYAISFNKTFLSLLLNSSWGLFWPSFTLKVRITEPYILLVILMRDGSIFKEPVTSLMNLVSPPSSSYFWRVVSSFTVISTEFSESLGLLNLSRFCFLEGDALLSWLPLKFWGLFERRECLLFSCYRESVLLEKWDWILRPFWPAGDRLLPRFISVDLFISVGGTRFISVDRSRLSYFYSLIFSGVSYCGVI